MKAAPPVPGPVVPQVPGPPSIDDVVVAGQGLGKRFDIYLSDRGRLLELLGNRRHHTEHWALRDVSFKVRRGRSFGVIGQNGAGKSTLLKLIGGITRPTEGTLEVRATLSTLLDLGLGFHEHFTGRENIRLNCALMGMSEARVREVMPEIVAFAELHDFIDYPVRTYSAGMNLRLGFAIAVHANSDILLVDEVLAVGDQYFQRRCVRKIEEFLDDGRTILLVSHDLHAIRHLCDEVLWLERGAVRACGPAREMVEQYLDAERARASGDRARPVAPPTPTLPPAPPVWKREVDDPALREAVLRAVALPDAATIWASSEATSPVDIVDGDTPIAQGTGEVRILRVLLLDGQGQPRERLRTGEDLVVAVTFRTTEPVPRPIFGVAIFRNDGTYVHGPNTRYDGVLDGTWHGIYTFFIQWKKLPLLAGHYRLSVAVFDQHHLKPHLWHNQLYDLEIAAEMEDHGLVLLDHAWGLIAHVEELP